MAIQAIITNIVKDPDATVVDVLYTDNATFKTPKEYRLQNFNLESFKSTVRSQIDAFSQTDNVDKVLTVGAFDSSAAIVAQTPKQIFATNVQIFRQMLRAIDLGLMTSADKSFTDLQTLIKGTFIPNYLDVL